MNRSEDQQSIDEIIGEAALTLLHKSAPINTQALIEQLKVMQQQAADRGQRDAITAAIVEVRNSISAGQARRGEAATSSNVLELFGQRDQTVDKRKH